MAETKNIPEINVLQEDDLAQELKELISTLPMESVRCSITLHQYEGHWYFKRVLQGVLSCQKHFQALDTDILFASNPKSGTTWLKALIFSLFNRKRYLNTQHHPLLANNPHVLVPNLELDLYIDKDSLPDLDSISSPRLLSTHLPYVSLPKSVIESSCKVVYICRDPKDTFVSFWHFANKLRLYSEGSNPVEEHFERFCRGVDLYGPFWEHILGYWKESLERPEKTLFMKYEDMKKQPAFCLKQLAEFLGCPISTEEESAGMVDDILNLCSFENLSNLEVNKTGKLPSGAENNTYFRRGEVGDAKTTLTVEMIEKLNTIIQQKLAKHGLSI